MKSKIFISFLIFFLVACLSTIVAINKVESLVRITDLLVILSSLFICFYFINKKTISYEFILSVIVVTLLLEVMGSYYQIYQMIEYGIPIDFNQSSSMKSIYSNKNIASMVYSIKTCLILLIFKKETSKFYKYFLFVLITATIYVIFLLSSRAVLLVIFISLAIIVAIIIIKIINNGRIRLSYFTKFKYYLLPLFLAFIFFKITINQKDELNVVDRMSTLVETGENESVNNRLRYYSQALNQFKNTPILGIGIGNWKIKSLDLDKENIFSYIVPYSVHNDFLEILAETGLFGFIPFVLFFFFIFKTIIDKIKFPEIRTKYVYLTLGFLFIVADFGINFPLDRPSILITFILFISVTVLMTRNPT
ncbi:MAG: O-antigen ligase family protein [Flammeovirgaceae bacterium]